MSDSTPESTLPEAGPLKSSRKKVTPSQPPALTPVTLEDPPALVELTPEQKAANLTASKRDAKAFIKDKSGLTDLEAGVMVDPSLCSPGHPQVTGNFIYQVLRNFGLKNGLLDVTKVNSTVSKTSPLGKLLSPLLSTWPTELGFDPKVPNRKSPSAPPLADIRSGIPDKVITRFNPLSPEFEKSLSKNCSFPDLGCGVSETDAMTSQMYGFPLRQIKSANPDSLLDGLCLKNSNLHVTTEGLKHCYTTHSEPAIYAAGRTIPIFEKHLFLRWGNFLPMVEACSVPAHVTSKYPSFITVDDYVSQQSRPSASPQLTWPFVWHPGSLRTPEYWVATARGLAARNIGYEQSCFPIHIINVFEDYDPHCPMMCMSFAVHLSLSLVLIQHVWVEMPTWTFNKKHISAASTLATELSSTGVIVDALAWNPLPLKSVANGALVTAFGVGCNLRKYDPFKGKIEVSYGSLEMSLGLNELSTTPFLKLQLSGSNFKNNSAPELPPFSGTSVGWHDLLARVTQKKFSVDSPLDHVTLKSLGALGGVLGVDYSIDWDRGTTTGFGSVASVSLQSYLTKTKFLLNALDKGQSLWKKDPQGNYVPATEEDILHPESVECNRISGKIPDSNTQFNQVFVEVEPGMTIDMGRVGLHDMLMKAVEISSYTRSVAKKETTEEEYSKGPLLK